MMIQSGLSLEGGNDVLLSTQDLSKHFGGLVAVDKLDLQIWLGEIHSIIGPNGAGKTTVFNMISGFIHPTAGEIHYAGHSIKDYRPYQLVEIGMARTFQRLELFGGMTVMENIMSGFHTKASSGIFSGASIWVKLGKRKGGFGRGRWRSSSL